MNLFVLISMILISVCYISVTSAQSCGVPVPFSTIQSAVDDPLCDVIDVAAGVYPDAVNVNRDLTIQGAGYNLSGPVTSIRNTITVNTAFVVLVVKDLVVEFSSGDGIVLGAVGAELDGDQFRVSFNSGEGIRFAQGIASTVVDIADCEVSDNALGIRSSLLNMDDCMVRFNTTNGGIRILSGGGSITNSSISSNTPVGIFFSGSSLFISDSIIAGNFSTGGLQLQGGLTTISGTDIVGNVAIGSGGGIHVSALPPAGLTLSNSTVDGNIAYLGGGGIGSGGFVDISNSAIKNNQAIYDDGINENGLGVGGGIYVFSGNSSITDSTLRNNSAVAQNGGVSVNSGGGLYLSSAADPASLNRVTVSGNFAQVDGGGIYSVSDLTVTNSTIVANRADENGGGFYAASGGSVLNHVTISNNIADDNDDGIGDGGGIFGNGAQLRFNLVGDNIDRSVIPNHHPDCSGGSVSPAYSLVRVSDGCPGFDAGPGNQLGSFASPLELFMLPLADNGGLTETMALGILSPALDAGTADCGSIIDNDKVDIDQRGISRELQDGNNDAGFDMDHCDIGAFETFSDGCVGSALVLTEYIYTDTRDVLSEISIATNGSVTVGSSANVLFRATSGVTLGSGFGVENGGEFLAEAGTVLCPL